MVIQAKTFYCLEEFDGPLTEWLSINHPQSLKEKALLPPAISNKSQVSKI
jgi:hypothetical protein